MSGIGEFLVRSSCCGPFPSRHFSRFGERTAWSHLAEDARVAATPTNQRAEEGLHGSTRGSHWYCDITRVWKWRGKSERLGGNTNKRKSLSLPEPEPDRQGPRKWFPA